MCGIAGVIVVKDSGPPATREQLLLMAASLRHRGPDEFGIYRDARAGLAHARLSIIDLSTGQQPLANEDRTLWVVYNGEIFNYVELKKELVGLGHTFRTESDTEVIVHAYEAWGDDAFARFNGQFAIALWDSEKRRAVFARDVFGICPLFLCEHEGRVFFASEIKAIFAGDRSIRRALDPTGLLQTFTFWTVVPPQSVFEGVTELLPGHVRTYERGAVREHAFSAVTFPQRGEESFRGSIEDAAASVRDALARATRLRMVRSDVRVGSYLSGGLDSSLVAALGHEETGGTLATFSLRFEDAEYDETDFQRTMARNLGSEHHEVVVTRADIARVFPEVIAQTERPILRTAPAPLFLLSGLVRGAGIKVVLTGEGADEVFAGYDLFREAKVRRFWARHPSSVLRPRLLERLYPYLARSPVAQQAMARQFFGRGLKRAPEPGFSHEPRWHSAEALQRLLTADLRKAASLRDVRADLLGDLPQGYRGYSTLAQDQYLEMRTLLSGYLLSSQGDRMLLGHSVEGRFPFLDPEVVALARSLPPSYKLAVLDEKHVLKRAARGRVPTAILSRKKQPYRAPDALCFATADAPGWVSDAICQERVAEAGVFDTRAVAQLWKKVQGRTSDGQFSNADNMALIGVLSTQLVYSTFVKNAPEVRPVVAKTLVDRVDQPTKEEYQAT